MSRRDEVRAALGGMLAVPGTVAGLRRELDDLRTQLGGVEARSLRTLPPDAVKQAEFRVFSQFGEDGIIQFLVQRVPIEREVFVEFGVENYQESNTRFLLVHDNWRGLIIDGGSAHR